MGRRLRAEQLTRGARADQLAGAGEHVALCSEAVLDIDAIFAGVLELPGDDDR